MMLGLPVLAFGAAASLPAIVSAAAASTTTGQSNDIGFSWGVPESSASSGSGNIYFQLSAPESYEWVGLGIGSSMSGANVFIMYEDGAGNVTLSTRQSYGHSEPQYESQPDIELISGSGVSDGVMVANVRCSACDSLDLSSSNSWIAAWRSGSPIQSTDMSERIDEHNGYTTFSVDFSGASIASDANPFLDAQAVAGSGSSSDSGSNSAVTESGGDHETIVVIHGIVMALAFIVLYPIGALLMPLLGKWFVHSTTQLLAYILMWAGFGLGYVSATQKGIFFDQVHTAMGTIVVALLGLQPLLGWFHHLHFKKHQGRGFISHVHIWYGRALIILGIVVGGLGLTLADEDGAFVIAYAVVAGILGGLYLLSAVYGAVKRRRRYNQHKPLSMSESR